MKTAMIVPLGMAPNILTEAIYLVNQADYKRKYQDDIQLVEVFSTVKGLDRYHDIKDKQLKTVFDLLKIKPYDINTNTVEEQFFGRVDEPIDDYIAKIKDLQQQYDKVILVITGGYRSISFQLSYVFSCLARDTDTMFTICTDPSLQGKELAEFYYPIDDTQKALIKREDIKFVPMRRFLDINNSSVENYLDIVENISTNINQKVILNTHKLTLSIGNNTVKFSPEHFLFLAIVYDYAKNSKKFPNYVKATIDTDGIIDLFIEYRDKWSIDVRGDNPAIFNKNNNSAADDLYAKISELISKVNKKLHDSIGAGGMRIISDMLEIKVSKYTDTQTGDKYANPYTELNADRIVIES